MVVVEEVQVVVVALQVVLQPVQANNRTGALFVSYSPGAGQKEFKVFMKQKVPDCSVQV